MVAIRVRTAKEEGRVKRILRMIPPVCFFMGSDPFTELESEYYREMKLRGKIPEELWANEGIDYKIKEAYDGILKHRLWGVDVDFHPQDQYFVVGCFQTGDLSEAEVLMDVEDELKIKLVSAAHDKFAEMTYAQVLRYVKSKCPT